MTMILQGLAKINSFNGFAQRNTARGSGAILLDFLGGEELKLLTPQGPQALTDEQVAVATGMVVQVSDPQGTLNQELLAYSQEHNTGAVTVTLEIEDRGLSIAKLTSFTTLDENGEPLEKPTLSIRGYLSVELSPPEDQVVQVEEIDSLLLQGAKAAKTTRQIALRERAEMRLREREAAKAGVTQPAVAGLDV